METALADQRLYQSVAQRIQNRIFDGVYKPGDRLPGERELAEEFSVSRVTIREAEIALQATGYIQVKTGSGAYVTDLADRNAQDVPAVNALELTEARLLFESEAAALAARSITDATLDRLEELVSIMASSTPDNDGASQAADREFHLVVAAASRNSAVQHVVESLWRMRSELPAVREIHAAVCANETAEERGDEHRDVLKALRNRDPVAARQAMQEHFSRLLGAMIDVTEAKAVEELRSEAAASRERFLNTLTQSGSV